jgi:hypothetical protein
MSIKSILCKLTLFSTMSLLSAQAATYYVATTGSDSNPGTSAQPFRTITYAYSLAGPGTTIIVEPGTYTDYQSGWGLHLGSSGTAANPIVLQSQVRGAAIIDGQNASDRNEGVYIDGSYNVLDGFEIKNGPDGGITIWGNGNQIINNEVDHNGSPASTSTNGRDGIYDDETTADNIYIGNYSHDNGRTGGSNLDHGMYICGSNDQIYNNVSIRNNGSGLQIAGYSTVSNLKVYNNVFAWNGTEGIIVWQDMNGVDIKNNISFHNTLYGIYFYAATGSGVVMDHNVIYGNGSGSYSSFSNGGGTVSVTQGTTISSDPMLANETQSGFDPHLNAGSPAIGAGYNFSSIFATDLAGNARPSSGNWDAGAYAYTGASTLGLPTVSVAASINAARVGLTIGSFTITRSGGTAAALTVNFSLTGTATGGADYTSPGTAVTIPIGASSVVVPIVPMPSASYADNKSATLTVLTNAAYATAPAGNATVAITGNGMPASLNAGKSGALIKWPSVAGKTYGVAYKNSLTDAAWTSLGSVITATGSSASYNDSTANQISARFYVVFVTD